MKQDNSLITIIVPIYKVEKYIHKCINSIINQTYTNLQIILVDDGSPDNCGEICDEYAKKDSRIEVIHKKNGGLSDARNVGIKNAKGKYIGFVDSDDYIKEDMYENLYNDIEENQADISICNFYNVIDGKNIIKNANDGIKEYNKIEILREILLDNKIQSYAWNKLYKRELFDNIEYPLGKKYEDIGTTFYILEKCNKIIVNGEPEYYYLNREDSIVNNNTEQTVMDYVDIVEQRYDYIQKKYRELEIYNIYYLTRILITADSDIKKLGNASEELSKRFNTLHEKVKVEFPKYECEIVKYFNENQKEQLKKLLKDA